MTWTSRHFPSKLLLMCGWFTQTATRETIAKHFQLPDIPLFAKPNYNVSPSHQVAAVRLHQS